MSRRELIGSGLATATGAALAGPLPAPALAAAGGDEGRVLRATVEMELLILFGYRHILASGELGARSEVLVSGIAVHEQAHVQRLVDELSRRGENPSRGPATVSQADKLLARRNASGRLRELSSERDCLALLYDLESLAIGAYYQALEKAGDPGLLLTASEIMGSEAQHAAAIGQLLHPGDFRRRVPTAFVQGKH